MREAFHGMAANPSYPRRRRRTRRQLSADERLQIVKLAASRTKTGAEIAIIFNVSVTAVYSLVSASKNKHKTVIVKKKQAEISRA